MGATLPRAIRTSSMISSLTDASAAKHTFEIAWALRVPTFR
jgi:hypothetical protein